MNLTSLLSELASLGVWRFWLLGCIAFLESMVLIGTLIPGTSIIVFVGFLTAQGTFDFGDALWVIALGAILGDAVSFVLGRRGARWFRGTRGVLAASHLERGQRFFARYGSTSILLGRFIGPLRSVVPFAAGLSGMDRWRFLAWNIGSGIAWAAALLSLGYVFGGAFRAIAVWTTRAGLVALALIVSVGIIAFLIERSGPVWALLASIARSIRHAIATNPDLVRLASRYPRTTTFLRNRIRRDTFSGLPLTLFVIVFVSFASDLIGVTRDILTNDLIVGVDVRVANLLAAVRDRHLIAVSLWVTTFGSTTVIAMVTLAGSVVLALSRRARLIAPFLITILGTGAATMVTKLLVHRPRPLTAYAVEHSFAFPSGHAAFAIACYGFLAYAFARASSRRHAGIHATIASVVIAALIGSSRLLLGVHYVSDVWGGYLFGALWLLIGIAIAELLRARRPMTYGVPLGRHRVRAIAVVIAATVLLLALSAARLRPARNTADPSDSPIVVADAAAMVAVFTRGELPQTTETLIGDPQEPLQFFIFARDEEHLVDLFVRAGWHRADDATPATIFRLARAVVTDRPYPEAPMTPDFWNATPHTLGFERSAERETVRVRHHIRFWRTSVITNDGLREYVGTASFDRALKWGITHTISPDIDTEREAVLASVRNDPGITRVEAIPFVRPTLGKNFSGDPFFTDGTAYLLMLR